ncbi:uncharacterized protein BDZ99DRAFT_393878 [Mytilinidion resinicola]|uniref:Protein kinase domain-containing protein n=1 Tax=Mytilinidion resinicola TaxID=574789 RepID=A0A6A6YE35_9PEZI|nr:uncharacterized protein BDZ99DRAFT_393878 [Mytilinidion resinicola]KAF2806859.1 hypothetical protein BDZ99DRAFT_393878 [Mytilinidion resinicola]
MAELALGIVATVDLAFRYGNLLVETYKTFKGAEADVEERILTVEAHWYRTRQQVEFLQKIWSTLDDEFQNIQSRTLRMLVGKLEAAVAQIERVQKKKNKDCETENKIGIRKMKYVLVKDSLDKAVQEFESWQKMFNPSWFLIMKVASPVIDQELEDDRTEVGSIVTARGLRDSLKEEPQIATKIFLPENGLVSASRTRIPFSTAELIQRTPTSKFSILDSVAGDPEVNINILNKDVRDLARKLSRADALTFGLLECKGVVKVFEPTKKKIVSFDFVFNIPEGLQHPKSLRGILLKADQDLSLSARFKVAQQLATSVSFIHTYGFVHKSIRPETVLIFESPNSTLAASFLLGFEKFRMAEGRTMRLGDCVWYKDIYRHPRRQGLKPEDEYSMQHDIYSLGVCLLEIGLWDTFVVYQDEKTTDPAPSPLLGVLQDQEEDEVKKATLVKDALVELATKMLPSRMGDKYTEIVVTCLTCLDETNADFGDDTEFEDEDGVTIGVRYIEKVRALRSCRFLKVEPIVLTRLDSPPTRVYIHLIVLVSVVLSSSC